MFCVVWFEHSNCLHITLWTLVLILWPVMIFIILAITRTKFPPRPKPTFIKLAQCPTQFMISFGPWMKCQGDSEKFSELTRMSF
ncbi:hypothetical protein FD755_008155 [Muntiacus reevesi]|uniref:Uncharacterized protein n=1 Tax=Muntiacus reevesi TaxID=9886 RepID=A0A5J5MM51_MUNRE|nr:hypothetical protein FD755_008155 [Muntiacus reevesi]